MRTENTLAPKLQIVPTGPSFGLKSFFAFASLYRQRRDLSRLDARQLRDVGVSETEALRESQRPVWDVPAHWLR